MENQENQTLDSENLEETKPKTSNEDGISENTSPNKNPDSEEIENNSKAPEEKNKEKKSSMSKIIKWLILFIVVIALGTIAYFFFTNSVKTVFSDLRETIFGTEGETRVVSVGSITDILDINNLQTVEYFYASVKEVDDDNGEPAYFIYYKGDVTAGINFDEISDDNIGIDKDNKIITIKLPETKILSTSIRTDEMDYIFVNDDYNTPEIFSESYTLANDDLREKCENDSNFMDQAKINTETAVKGLIQPWIEQIDSEYEIVFK